MENSLNYVVKNKNRKSFGEMTLSESRVPLRRGEHVPQATYS
jgi:hypothetical protein